MKIKYRSITVLVIFSAAFFYIAWYVNERSYKITPTAIISKQENTVPLELSYNQVIVSKVGQEKDKSKYDGEVVTWKAKISAHESQITGIKFCVVDKDHQNVDIQEVCDWFWASSADTMNAHDSQKWDGLWVDYILKYYKVPFNKDSYFYNEIYTVTGRVNGLDCGWDGADNKCIPDIEIIKITK